MLTGQTLIGSDQKVIAVVLCQLQKPAVRNFLPSNLTGVLDLMLRQELRQLPGCFDREEFSTNQVRRLVRGGVFQDGADVVFPQPEVLRDL